MKTIIIRIVLAVTGYQVPTQELESRLSAIAPVRIEVIDLANSQAKENHDRLHYQLVSLHAKPGPKLYLHHYYIGGYSGGKCYARFQVGNVAILGDERYAERDLAVILHEIGHKFGLRHDEAGCSVMSPQPCSLEFSEQDVLRAKKWLRKKR